MKLFFLLAGTIAGALLVHGCGTSNNDAGFVGGGGGGAGTGGSAGESGGTGGGESGGTGGGDTGGTGGGTGGGGTGGGVVGGSGGGTGGGIVDASFDVDFTYDAPHNEASLLDACVDESVSTEPVPLDIYFMLDASTSMSDPAGYGTAGDCNVSTTNFQPSVNSRWCKAINAIAGYVSSPAATGNRAALQYFRHYTNHNCNGTGYDVPAVALGALSGSYSGHAQVMVEQAYGGLNWAYPHNATPTEGALRGLALFTAANQTPGRIIIGILVTDGEPTSCNTSDSVLRGIAQNHFNSTGIHTFIVGITGASFNKLENWASYTGAISHDNINGSCGNGANTCHHYNVGDGDPAVFIAALNQIQQAVLSCTFQFPQPAQGILDPNVVSVDYYPGGQPPPIEIPRVPSAQDCVGAGWYYDDPNQPTLINLCPDTCNTVQADANAEVKIRIACEGA